MAAHLWNITQSGSLLWMETCWEGETTIQRFYAELASDEPTFRVPGLDFEAKGILLDSQHFVIPGWCWPDRKNPDGTSSSRDVIFSRPGLAELTARSVYLHYLNALTSEDATG